MAPKRGSDPLHDIDAALRQGNPAAAAALARRALSEPDLHRAALRKLVHALLLQGDLDTAGLWAERLHRLQPAVAEDITLAAIVSLRQEKRDEALDRLRRALVADPLHPLAARALAGIDPFPGDLRDAVVRALAWNADADPACRATLAMLCTRGVLEDAAYLQDGDVQGVVRLAPGDPGATLQLVWRGLVVAAAELTGTSGDLCPFRLPIPPELRGNAPLEVRRGARLVTGGRFTAAQTRAPRLAGQIIDGGSGLLVKAWDAAVPERPVVVEAEGADGTRRTLTFRPRPDGAPPTLGAVEPQPLAWAGTQPPRLRFALTGEPLDPLRPPGLAGPKVSGETPPTVPATPVDIIVPVYGDAAATRACLASLRHFPGGVPAEIILIEDGAPDPDIRKLMAEVAAGSGVTVLHNPGNLGFVRSVNRGMALHPDRDVLLLNADTVVHGDWLARLQRAAYRAGDIGTVTPWSNDATILSYPTVDPPTPLDQVNVPEMDTAAATALADRTLEIPTAVGFCMYIRRACLDEVGYFDAEAFGSGYGEENDFCCRAAAAGWRHVVALDTYVGHVGGGSFGAEKAARIANALKVLDARHPRYNAGVHSFMAADPLRQYRRALDLPRLKQPDADGTLLICAKLGGGTDRFVYEQMERLRADGRRVVLARPRRTEEGACAIHLEFPDRPDLVSLEFVGDAELDALFQVLRRLRLTKAILHHLMHLSEAALAVLLDGRAYDIHIHDYSWICPRINLVDDSGRYCGEPALPTCEDCIRHNGQEFRPGITATSLRAWAGGVLAGARRAVCPTQDTADRITHHLPATPVSVEPHERIVSVVEPLRHGAEARVAVFGAISDVKGYEVLRACIADAVRRALPLEFVLVGFSKDDVGLIAAGPVTITGRYEEGHGAAIARAAGCNVALLPSIWPETWCYTLSEAWRAELPVVAFELGAQAERIRVPGGGALLSLETPAPILNDTLISLGMLRWRPERLETVTP